ncbi:MAG TPA: YobA family protein [Bacillus sp. (in: firmicutes)]|uniref:YobA family protein n=1 Tax=Bacillus litorisediminis TaxID=2922713 RepID=UPI001FAD842D|nr:YobA family protein [Bacillus litorisediminis]HWO75751.1 YobA family protein [Bacillus sp. (in: firmicutes)]
MLKKGIIVIAAVLFLAGCGTARDTTSGDEGDTVNYRESEPMFITDLMAEGEMKRVLIKDIIYGIEEETEIVNDKGEELAFEDLELGMRVIPESTGPILESYPGQTGAKKIMVLTDDESKAEAAVVRSVVHEIKNEELDGFTIVKELKKTESGYEIHADVSSGTQPNRVYLYDMATQKLELQP